MFYLIINDMFTRYGLIGAHGIFLDSMAAYNT